MNSKGWVVTLLLAGLVASISPSSARAGAEIEWCHDYSTAWKDSKAQHKLLYVSVHATWCGPCKTMSRTTLRDPRVADQINQLCAAVHLDADRDATLVRQLPVHAYPTELFFAPSGEVVARIEGYKGVDEFLNHVRKAASRTGVVAARTNARGDSLVAASAARTTAKQKRTLDRTPAQASEQRPQYVLQNAVVAAPVQSERPAQQETGVQASTTGLLASVSKVSDPAAAPALGGYCPVSMVKQGIMVVGASVHTADFAGSSYRFASATNRALFESNPSQYLPAEGGNCVVTWSENHRWVTGRLDFPAIFGDHVYFFAGERQRGKFLKDPDFYVDSNGRAYREAPSALRETTSAR